MAVASSSNPITSVAPSSSPITSVPDSYPPSYQPSQQQLLARLTLEMRGERFVVERETLLNLPESVLLGMFPNGLILSRQQLGWPDEEDDGENQVYPIDVSQFRDRGFCFLGRTSCRWLITYLMYLCSACCSIVNHHPALKSSTSLPSLWSSPSNHNNNIEPPFDRKPNLSSPHFALAVRPCFIPIHPLLLVSSPYRFLRDLHLSRLFPQTTTPQQ
jgi:hypothetical protein